MTRWLATLVALVLPHARAAHAADGIDREAMLDALAQVETGNRWGGKPGAFGELGRCQFMQATWREYTNAPFHVYANRDCAISRKVERAHFAKVCAGLRARGLPVEPAFIAAAWRFGLGLAAKCVRADSAQRAANLYNDAIARKAKQ